MLVLLVAGCADLVPPEDETAATSDLVVLALAPAAPAASGTTFWVSNQRATTASLYHADAQSNLYLRLQFPAASLRSLDGVTLGPDDSVAVTVQPRSGGYGFTMEPEGLVFADANRPTALFAFGRYGDPTVADGIFADQTTYLRALDAWAEVGFDRWAVAPGSGPAGVDEIRGSLEAAGRVVLAARRP